MYQSPIELICKNIQQKIDDYAFNAIGELSVNVNKDELMRALKYDRGQYDKGYADGEWEMFTLITSAFYGKEYYFMQDDGIVYSRASCEYMKKDDAISEFLRVIGE